MPDIYDVPDWWEPDVFWNWRRRLKQEWLARNLTLHRRHALLTLLSFVGDAGLFPSDAAVAQAANCCARTVRRARMDARELGLLTWRASRKLVDGRWRQGPNYYTVVVPERPVCPEGQRGRRKKKASKQEALQAMLSAARGQGDLLSARRVAFEAAQRATAQAKAAPACSNSFLRLTKFNL